VSAATPVPAYLPEGDRPRASELDPDVERLITERRARDRRGSALTTDRLVTYALAVGFLAASFTFLAVTTSTRHPSLSVVLLYVLLYALLSHVNFEIDAHGAVPVQLVLVPMLFTLPLAWVPLCVAAGYLLRDPVGIVKGQLTPWRGALRLVSSWHALGPAVVLYYLAGEGPPQWSDGPVYALALLAMIAVDFAIGRIRELGLGIKGRPLRGSYLIYGVDLALAPVGLLVAFADVGHRDLVVLVLPLVGLLQLFAKEREQRLDAALELGHAYRGTAMLLGDVVEADDAYTGEHSRDVVELTLAVVDRLRLGPRERRNAELVALLHDVGKIRVPSEIINKPGPLTEDELAVMRLHTVEGEAMLTRVGGLLGDVGQMVRSCHERWDGEGYPDRLRGEATPLIARIVCCTDAFSAMTTNRPYRKALPTEDALAELERCAGTQFDPDVVTALVAVVR
jgi:HD-GYP domain-containing protein (c-di-GMP phosphodiesterase class II)